MKLHRSLFFALVATGFAAVNFATAQTAPSALGPYHDPYPITLGGGLSNFNVDWDKSRMQGITLWAEWRFTFLPAAMAGLGLEAEGRNIDYNRPVTVPANFRERTLLFGPMYTMGQFRHVQPYFKVLEGMGNIDTYAPAHGKVPATTHDSQVVGAPGLGLKLRLTSHIWARIEYEYQAWPNAFGKTLDPQGFTVGAGYEFRGIRGSR